MHLPLSATLESTEVAMKYPIEQETQEVLSRHSAHPVLQAVQAVVDGSK